MSKTTSPTAPQQTQKKSIHSVFVLALEGPPLMPTRPAKAKWLLKQGKAKVASRCPFTIRLTYSISAPICQPVSLAIDDGETVGLAAVQTNQTHQRVVFAAQMRLRGRDITDALSRRQRLRRARKRRRRSRAQKRYYKTQPLPPSIRADVSAKMRLIEKITSILPVSEIRWELLSFKIEAERARRRKTEGPRLLPPYLQTSDPQPKPAFRLGEKKRVRLLLRDDSRCCVCCRVVTIDTAAFYRIGRPKRLGSYITLCEKCADKIRRDRWLMSFDSDKYTDARGPGRVMHGKIEFGRRLKAMNLPIFLVNGWRTEQCRKQMDLNKSHISDALAIASRGNRCLLMDTAFIVRLRARHQRKRFFENPGDLDIQRVKRGKSKSVRRRARRILYTARYGAGGVKNKRQTLGYTNEPFAPYEGLYLTESGERGLIKNRRIPSAETIPAKAKLAKIFRRGDIVKTAEGRRANAPTLSHRCRVRRAEVVTLFATGKVGIRFFDLSPQSTPQRTARIPERLTLVERGKPMQLISVPLPP